MVAVGCRQVKALRGEDLVLELVASHLDMASRHPFGDLSNARTRSVEFRRDRLRQANPRRVSPAMRATAYGDWLPSWPTVLELDETAKVTMRSAATTASELWSSQIWYP
jgi:hypothetical protein